MRNRLIQLLSDNRRPFRPVADSIRMQAGASEATVYLYDAIVNDRATAEWWGGVCPQDMVPALAALDVDTIHLRVNSGGGDVFAANAICQALREHPATVVGHIDGVAASAATAICCACDQTVIAPGAMYMIHQSWTLGWGNADDLEKTVALLRQIDGQLADTYVGVSEQDREKILAWMKAETWFTAAQAVEAGFVGQVAEGAAKGDGGAKATSASASAWNLRAYERPPAPAQASAPPADGPAPDAAYATPDQRHRIQQRLRLSQLCCPIG